MYRKYSYFTDNWALFQNFDQWIVSKLPLIRGNVYEFGCGLKPLKELILQYADNYTGVDWENSLHDVHPDIFADLNKPLGMLNDSIADTVISFSVMEHLYNPANLVNEGYRILKPGGYMLLQIPFQWWVHEAPYDYCRFTRYGLQKIFEGAGFTDIIIEEQCLFWTTWIIKLNYHLSGTILCRIRPGILQRAVRVLLFKPFFLVNQSIAILLDKINPNPTETQGYTVVAKKPL